MMKISMQVDVIILIADGYRRNNHFLELLIAYVHQIQIKFNSSE